MAYTVIAEAAGNASTTVISAATHFTNQQIGQASAIAISALDGELRVTLAGTTPTTTTGVPITQGQTRVFPANVWTAQWLSASGTVRYYVALLNDV